MILSPYDEGFDAGYVGSLDDCPYDELSDEGYEWLRGYDDGNQAFENDQFYFNYDLYD